MQTAPTDKAVLPEKARAGIEVLHRVVESLLTTSRYVDEEGEATQALADLSDCIADPPFPFRLARAAAGVQVSPPAACTRSHPHELMDAECERLTVVAREQNAAARGVEVSPPAPPAEPLNRAYEAGWVQCAIWAERDDLITDCDSAAYTRERDAALAKIAAIEVSPAAQMPCPECGGKRIAKEAQGSAWPFPCPACNGTGEVPRDAGTLTPEQEADLKACPLCGSTPRLADLGGWEVLCDCGLCFELPGDGDSLDRMKTIAAWNTRTSGVRAPLHVATVVASTYGDAEVQWPVKPRELPAGTKLYALPDGVAGTFADPTGTFTDKRGTFADPALLDAHGVKDCGEAGHAEGRCGNAQCLPGNAGVDLPDGGPGRGA